MAFVIQVYIVEFDLAARLSCPQLLNQGYHQDGNQLSSKAVASWARMSADAERHESIFLVLGERFKTAWSKL